MEIIKHRNGIKTVALTPAEERLIREKSATHSMVQIRQKLGNRISRHMVNKFIKDNHLPQKITKPSRRREKPAQNEFFDESAQEWI